MKCYRVFNTKAKAKAFIDKLNDEMPLADMNAETYTRIKEEKDGEFIVGIDHRAPAWSKEGAITLLQARADGWFATPSQVGEPELDFTKPQLIDNSADYSQFNPEDFTPTNE